MKTTILTLEIVTGFAFCALGYLLFLAWAVS